jgi:uncharacterized protein YuzE
MEATMKRFTYDEEANAAYIYLKEGADFSHTKTILEGEILIAIDIDIDGDIIGVEIVG